MARRQGGTLGTFTPLSTPNAPTGLSVSTSIGSASVSFTAPTDTGDGAITSYIVTAIDESTGVSTGATGSASPITVSPGTGTFKIRAQAVNNFGPGRLTEFDTGNVITYSGAELYAWGNPQDGRLGNNTNVGTFNSPIQIGALTNWYLVSAGTSSSFGRKTDGTLWSWGFNGQGRLGDGTDNPTNRSSPVQIGALTTWNQVGASSDGCGAVKTDGTLWAWGNNSYGQLGQSNKISRSSPVQVGSSTSWKQFAGGQRTAFAVTTTGALYAWGDNTFGTNAQGNAGAATSRSSPTQVGALLDWQFVASGHYHCLAIKTNNTLWMWGREVISGCLGQNTYSDSRSSPVQVGALTNWATGGTGVFHTVCVKTDGTLWSWGRSYDGELGQSNRTSRSSPVQVGSMTNWAQVDTRFKSTLAVKTDGTLWAWGLNTNGQLGDGTTTNRSSPVLIGALTTWISIGAGDYHSLATLGVV